MSLFYFLCTFYKFFQIFVWEFSSSVERRCLRNNKSMECGLLDDVCLSRQTLLLLYTPRYTYTDILAQLTDMLQWSMLHKDSAHYIQGGSCSGHMVALLLSNHHHYCSRRTNCRQGKANRKMFLTFFFTFDISTHLLIGPSFWHTLI